MGDKEIALLQLFTLSTCDTTFRLILFKTCIFCIIFLLLVFWGFFIFVFFGVFWWGRGFEREKKKSLDGNFESYREV